MPFIEHNEEERKRIENLIKDMEEKVAQHNQAIGRLKAQLAQGTWCSDPDILKGDKASTS